MSTKDDGGPAYPQLSTAWNDTTHEYELSMSLDGMSLRDYFAAKAMQGLIASPRGLLATTTPGGVCADDYASIAYVIADAMLAARNQGEQQ